MTTFHLPNSPARSQFLTEEEKVASLHRLILDARGATDEADVNQEKFSWHWVKRSSNLKSYYFVECTDGILGSISGLQCQYDTFESEFFCDHHTVRQKNLFFNVSIILITKVILILTFPPNYYQNFWVHQHHRPVAHGSTQYGRVHHCDQRFFLVR